MRDIPIIFQAPMVRALLAGRKTQTRRLAWLKPRNPASGRIKDSYQRPSLWQSVDPGDRLWVKESFTAHWGRPTPSGRAIFNASVKQSDGSFIQATPADPIIAYYAADGSTMSRWRPSIHMPRWASRLTLIVTSVKVEPLQDISEADAMAEGVSFDATLPSDVHRHFVPLDNGECITGWDARETYAGLWDHINEVGSWGSNPEVVALTFTVIRENIDRVSMAS